MVELFLTNSYLTSSIYASFDVYTGKEPTFREHSVPLEKIFQPGQQDFKEGAEHGEDHPSIDHLDISRTWKRLVDTHVAERTIYYMCVYICNAIDNIIKITYNVAITSIAVRLTWTTISKYSSMKLLIIWLTYVNIAVGSVT